MSQFPADLVEALPVPGRKQSVITYLVKAAGQDMLEKAPDELDDIECDFSTAIAAFLAIGEGDGSIIDSQDSGIGDSHPEDIGGEVF